MKKFSNARKTLTQILFYAIELFAVAGLLTYISCRVYEISSETRLLTIIERFVLFYGIYQFVVIITLGNINDIKADEYLALHTMSEYAILAVESKNDSLLIFSRKKIESQLDTKNFNDVKVQTLYKKYHRLFRIAI